MVYAIHTIATSSVLHSSNNCSTTWQLSMQQQQVLLLSAGQPPLGQQAQQCAVQASCRFLQLLGRL
jgi:hypothetical protein